ncbi:uncharacterized protein PHACADRAFT_206300 [Phanerochaete carnosa HHB-10118-sp]|uniref:Uncharacterized protein n=1 Tax=Phanerochaete carnosa (strain HHB-10118-sp) TaxID=650164 RepID=K5XAY5_PHACS|nr:uncharacterized protein PHACADRAFT_206300 [Phanerochaete carnosa HHB-10118-sp]EKM60102.1 hypothetical protein PHACADRAFT_206300 [Phanerochaete carnosa HHB-10118-sp]
MAVWLYGHEAAAQEIRSRASGTGLGTCDECRGCAAGQSRLKFYRDGHFALNRIHQLGYTRVSVVGNEDGDYAREPASVLLGGRFDGWLAHAALMVDRLPGSCAADRTAYNLPTAPDLRQAVHAPRTTCPRCTSSGTTPSNTTSDSDGSRMLPSWSTGSPALAPLTAPRTTSPPLPICVKPYTLPGRPARAARPAERLHRTPPRTRTPGAPSPCDRLHFEFLTLQAQPQDENMCWCRCLRTIGQATEEVEKEGASGIGREYRDACSMLNGEWQRFGDLKARISQGGRLGTHCDEQRLGVYARAELSAQTTNRLVDEQT